MILKTNLLPYQKAAYDKLCGLKVNALYMEMGTGKTRVGLELINNKLELGKIDNVLWLCPCNIISDLRSNIDKHIDDNGLIKIHGIESLSQSDKLYVELLNMVANSKTYIVVDESNLVKNHFAKRTKRIGEIAKLCEYRTILNGTPISKNEADLYAQWYILDPRIFGYRSFWSFSANHLEYDDYGRVRRVLNLDYLTEKIDPYTYTATKEDAGLNLPDKGYYNKYFFLTSKQAEEYDNVKEALLDKVDEFDSTTIYRLFTGLQRVTSGDYITKLFPMEHKPMFSEPEDNPRIKALLSCFDMQEKTIIWCKFENEITAIQQVIEQTYGKDSFALLYGGLSSKKRITELEKFEREANFLIANKPCGGYGLNLQFCHEMIYYNNDFNWATRAQSEDRVHRIGQSHDVNITNICALSKVDERILKNLDRKGNLSDSFKSEMKKRSRSTISNWIDGKD